MNNGTEFEQHLLRVANLTGATYTDSGSDSGGSGSGSSSSSNYSFGCIEDYDPTDNAIRFEFWVCGVLMNVVGILGILGNVLSLVILSRPQMRSSINYLLIGLAKCDVILIVTSILLFGIPAIYPYTGYFYYYFYIVHPRISPYVYPIAMIAQTASVYLTITVTLERFVAVCHPLRARSLCTCGRANLLVRICIGFAIIYNIPRFWEVAVQRYEYAADKYVFCVIASTMRSNNQYIEIYIHWCYLIFIYFVPFLNLAIMNALIYRQVRRANRERQRLSRTERREIGLATMLLAVVIVFFLCNILALIINLVEAFFHTFNDYLVKSSNFLVTINSSVNFVIYVIFGEKFKQIFLLIFCKRRIGRDSPDTLMHEDSSFSNGGHICENGSVHRAASGRFHRHSTMRSSGHSVNHFNHNNNYVHNNSGVSNANRLNRVRIPSPGPCIYYPARKQLCMPVVSRDITAEWEDDETHHILSSAGQTISSSAF